MLPKPISGSLAYQVCAVVVADGHDRERKRVAIERQQDAAGREHGRLAARLPAEPLRELVAQPLFQLVGVALDPLGGVGAAAWPCSRAAALMALSLKSAGLSQITPCQSHFGAAGAWIVVRRAIVRQRRFPVVVQNDRPEQPQLLVLVDHHAGVAVGKAGIVGHHERLAPGACALGQPRAEHGHVVGRALARAAIPRDQQVAVGTLDDARRVVVLAD